MVGMSISVFVSHLRALRGMDVCPVLRRSFAAFLENSFVVCKGRSRPREISPQIVVLQNVRWRIVHKLAEVGLFRQGIMMDYGSLCPFELEDRLLLLVFVDSLKTWDVRVGWRD